jgi:hypothetical protein
MGDLSYSYDGAHEQPKILFFFFSQSLWKIVKHEKVTTHFSENFKNKTFAEKLFQTLKVLFVNTISNKL